MVDPFWNPLVRLGDLWGMVQLPPFRVITPLAVHTFGGLVVNMPTWLQIESSAWRPYFTAVVEDMGGAWPLGGFPHSLEFWGGGGGAGAGAGSPAEAAP